MKLLEYLFLDLDHFNVSVLAILFAHLRQVIIMRWVILKTKNIFCVLVAFFVVALYACAESGIHKHKDINIENNFSP